MGRDILHRHGLCISEAVAAVSLVVGIEYGDVLPVIRDADPVILVSIGGEVDGAHQIAALLVLPEEHDHVILIVVHHQPLEALPAEVDLPKGGFLLIECVGVLEELMHLPVLLVLVQEIPVKLFLVVPLVPLAKLHAHKEQLLARMSQKIGIESPCAAKLVLVIAGHFPHDRAFHMNDLVVRDGQDKVLRESVHHRECDILMMMLPEEGVQLEIVAHIIHPAHVPLEIEAQSANLRGTADQGPGGGFLGNHHNAGLYGKCHSVQFPEEIDGLQVLMPAVDIGGPSAALPVIIQVQHRGHGVHPDTVHMALLQPEPRRGKQEALDLRPAVVKDPGAPGSVLPLIGIAVLVAAAAVEFIQAVGVLAEMGRHPVQDHGDAILMHMVHEPQKVLRRAEPRRGAEIPCTLIAPGHIQGMLQHRQQFNGGVAHFLDVGGQFLRQILIIVEIPVFPLLPGPQMDLIDIQRGIVDLMLLLFFQEGVVGPMEALDIIELAGGGGPCFRMEGVGIGLESHLTILSGDGELIGSKFRQLGDKALPDFAFTGKPVNALLPVVEVAHHRHGLRMGGPDPEPPAQFAPLFVWMRAEIAPAVGERTGMEALGLIFFCHSLPPCIAGRRRGSVPKEPVSPVPRPPLLRQAARRFQRLVPDALTVA